MSKNGQTSSSNYELLTRSKDIEALDSLHLGLARESAGKYRVGEVTEWIHGNLNVYIPVYVDSSENHAECHLLIRFPLSYKLEDGNYPGNAD
ncbi:hypothetical protein B0J14DRAFT_597212 [Halenospora varia]|nr:hypothetical protein B0J14DRAFT_597212 [Halenospora varia]